VPIDQLNRSGIVERYTALLSNKSGSIKEHTQMIDSYSYCGVCPQCPCIH